MTVNLARRRVDVVAMQWLTTLPVRAARRVAAHRGEAAVWAGFVFCVAVAVRVAGLAPRVSGWLRGDVGDGVPAAVLLALTLAWLPLMVIDMKRCTRETALRKHVQADLDRRRHAEQEVANARAADVTAVTAVLADGGPMIVYQPIVDMATERVVGFEALSRFPDGGNPADWFARAARVGLGRELELAAARCAIAELPQLPEDTYLSVNVGADTLADDRLAQLVREAPGRRLVVELTEHSAVGDYAYCRAAIARLRGYGVKLAVDDAGAGYASLRHVVDLAPDVIKVDRALVKGVDVDPARRSLVLTLVTFAADLGAQIVAEGVETPAEAAQLRAWGVRMAQGWHFGRPQPLPVPIAGECYRPLARVASASSAASAASRAL